MLRQQGFTLIEILVVMVLITVVVSVMLLSINLSSPAKRIEAVADKLQQQLLLAYQTAVLQQREFGFSLTPQGYAFVEYQEGEWFISEEKNLAPEILPEALEPTLLIDDQAIKPIKLDQPEPQVLLLSSGETTPFEFDLEDRDSAWRIKLQGDFLGRVQQLLEAPL